MNLFYDLALKTIADGVEELCYTPIWMDYHFIAIYVSILNIVKYDFHSSERIAL